MTTYISFSAEINVNTTENLIAVLAQQANQGVDHVYLMLSTPGGAVMNGLNLYNVMRAMPFKITTHNVGNVDSIGNAVFLAGNVLPALIQPSCSMESGSISRRELGWNKKTFRKI
jgi:ATP-dependent protease ClpP protease subunit